MKLVGGCYCGTIRYVAEGEPDLKAQCHCRECRYYSGGAPSLVIVMPLAGFAYTRGAPKRFARPDLPRPVTREFCPDCGVHLANRAPDLPRVVLKVGTLDDPGLFGGPDMAVFTVDQLSFHHIPPGLPAYERFPGWDKNPAP